MGTSMGKLAAELDGLQAYNVLVTIFTDGEENASVEYSGKLIKKMVEDLKEKKWTFTYIGTDHDVDKIALSLSISNVMKFEKDSESINAMFLKESQARMAFSQKIRNKQDAKDDFYQ